MYRFLDRLDPDDVQAIAAQAFVEMLEGGFTALAEFHYLRITTRTAAPTPISPRMGEGHRGGGRGGPASA